MKTNKFLTSIFFPDEAQFGDPVYYQKAIESELECDLLAHKSGGNMAYFKGCHAMVYPKKNNVVSDADMQNGKHIVKDEDFKYTIVVYLGMKGDSISNPIELISTLPEGTIMNVMECDKYDVLVFSEFSLILFDIKLELE